jgi:integrase
MNLGRRCTPPKVDSIPYFPMVKEENARQGFLTDQQYAKLRDELPDYLKPLFITAYVTGVRLGELLAWIWDGVDFAQSFVTLHADETKSGYSRAVPIVEGDMRKWLLWSREHAEDCARVFHREGGANQAVQDCLEIGLRISRCSRTQIPRPAPDGGSEYAPRRCSTSRAYAYYRAPDRFNGAPLQHRGYRRYQNSQAAHGTAND